MNLQHIGLVGYGEGGKIFSVGLQKQVANVRACDTQFDAEATPSTHAGCTPPCNVMIDVGVAHPGRALLRPDIDTGGFR